jgi:hypothetical protein
LEDVLNLYRIFTDLLGRLSGPLTMRLFLQPAVSTFFAIRDGLKDARTGRRPYFWAMITHPKGGQRLLEGWRSVMKVFIMAIVLDVVYQWMVFRWFYPVESILTAVILAIVPYLVLRGIVNRIARLWIRPNGGSAR